MGILFGFFVTIAVGATVAWGQPAPIVQPGAPGKAAKTVAPAQSAFSVVKVAEGAVGLMQGNLGGDMLGMGGQWSTYWNGDIYGKQIARGVGKSIVAAG